MARPSRCCGDDTPVPNPVARPLADIAGDIRDRLTVLLNATQVIRYACPDEDPHLQSVIRLVEQQVHCLRRLADEICQDRYPDPGAGDYGPPVSGPGPTR